MLKKKLKASLARGLFIRAFTKCAGGQLDGKAISSILLAMLDLFNNVFLQTSQNLEGTDLRNNEIADFLLSRLHSPPLPRRFPNSVLITIDVHYRHLPSASWSRESIFQRSNVLQSTSFFVRALRLTYRRCRRRGGARPWNAHISLSAG